MSDDERSFLQSQIMSLQSEVKQLIREVAAVKAQLNWKQNWYSPIVTGLVIAVALGVGNAFVG